MAKIYNISSSCCFVDTLAQKLLNDCTDDHQSLADILILLPNRRACRSLADAFVRLKGMEPMLLPQMRAIGDINEDEILLVNPQSYTDSLNIPRAISPLERTLLLTKLITKRYQEFGLTAITISQACELAGTLGNLLDNVSLHNLDWSNLEKIIPDEYAIHWQETIKFLTILTHYWPKILDEQSVVDTVTRRNLLMRKQCEIWQANPTDQRIIIAGTTAVSPIMKELVNTVFHLPNGEIYLDGLDKFLDNDAWECIDESHPQYELKQLLDFLQLNRSQIVDLVPPQNIMREKLISEIMRPAQMSHLWRNLNNSITTDAITGLHLMECNDIREEALSIALLIRHTLESPNKTIALVTQDRNLARRVCGELRRWNISVDDSAGIPLSLSPWGIFIRLVASAAMNPSSKPICLALLKNCFLYDACKNNRADAEKVDKIIWRLKQSDNEAQNFLDSILKTIQPLTELLNQPSVAFGDLLQQHISICEKLSGQTSSRQLTLWQNDDGKAGADFVAELLDKSNLIDTVTPEDYISLLEKLMSGITVRNSVATHPRIKILGSLEARLNHYDIIVIGGCNEGIWPQSPENDPWMSRPMKRDFGLNQPEQQIGVSALDFSNLLGAATVYLSRSQINDGAQTLKSRWWLRLTTVLQALNIDITKLYDTYYTQLCKSIDQPQPSEIIKLSPPDPHPPLDARPHKLSATAFEKLLRDPYSVFAEYILQLKPLDELDTTADQSDFGNLVHHVLDDFARKYPEQLPENAEEILLSMGDVAFQQADFSAEKTTFWLPKFKQIIEWIIAQEKNYRQQIAHIHSEIWGKLFLENTLMGTFEIYAKADRIDLTYDKKYNIIDYKTGRARSAKEVKAGYAPQLPIEALIAQTGGFTNLPPAEINQLMYWKLGDKIVSITDNLEQLLDKTKEHLIEIINLFAKVETGYLSRPNPKHVPEYSDYEHLARVKEWSVKDEGDDN